MHSTGWMSSSTLSHLAAGIILESKEAPTLLFNDKMRDYERLRFQRGGSGDTAIEGNGRVTT